MNLFRWLRLFSSRRNDVGYIPPTPEQTRRMSHVLIDPKAYWIGFEEGYNARYDDEDYHAIKRAAGMAMAHYPTPDNPNVVSLARHRSWQSPKGAA